MSNAERQKLWRQRKKNEVPKHLRAKPMSKLQEGDEFVAMTAAEIQNQLRLIGMGKVKADQGQVQALKVLLEVAQRRADAENSVLKGMAADLRDWSTMFPAPAASGDDATADRADAEKLGSSSDSAQSSPSLDGIPAPPKGGAGIPIQTVGTLPPDRRDTMKRSNKPRDRDTGHADRLPWNRADQQRGF